MMADPSRSASRPAEASSRPAENSSRPAEASGGAELRFLGLTAGYRGIPLTSGLTCDVRAGEITVLVGPNGAGKSTILRTVVGELLPTGGTMLIEGRPRGAYSRRELARRISAVLTDRVRPEMMTCREVAAAGRYPYTGLMGHLSPEDEKKVDEVLREVHGEMLAERLFSRASDGERQRILLARALCQEPRILVLDEPTSFLDIRYKLEFLTILRRLARENGLAVLLSLHEIDLAGKIADQVISVGADHTVSVGPPEEVFREERVQALFSIRTGSFDPLLGSAELARVEGRPEVLVISSGGAGIPVYRNLSRRGIPFAAGILPENDIDYRAAMKIAARVIGAEAFAPVPAEVMEKAVRTLREVRQVIYAGGRLLPENRELVRMAAENHKLSEAGRQK
jgi:iron complex transport system ATP-binding protein